MADFMEQLLMRQLFGGSSYGLPMEYGEDDAGNLVWDTNHLQDILELLESPTMSAFLPFGGYDPGAFGDVQLEPEVTALPADPLAPYLSFGEDSIEGVIARAVQAGAPTSEIMAELGFDRLDEVGKADYDQYSLLANELRTGRQQYETEMLQIPGMVRDPASGAINYQGAGTVEGNSLIVPKSEQSEAAKAYTDNGLPLPTARFTADDYVDTAPFVTALERAQGKLAEVEAANTGPTMQSLREQLAGLGRRDVLGPRSGPSRNGRGRDGVSTVERAVSGIPNLDVQDTELPALGAGRVDPNANLLAALSMSGAAAEPAGSVEDAVTRAFRQPRNGPVRGGGGRNLHERGQDKSIFGGARYSDAYKQLQDQLRTQMRDRQLSDGETGIARIEAYRRGQGLRAQQEHGQARAQAADARGETPLRRILMERVLGLGNMR